MRPLLIDFFRCNFPGPNTKPMHHKLEKNENKTLNLYVLDDMNGQVIQCWSSGSGPHCRIFVLFSREIIQQVRDRFINGEILCYN